MFMMISLQEVNIDGDNGQRQVEEQAEHDIGEEGYLKRMHKMITEVIVDEDWFVSSEQLFSIHTHFSIVFEWANFKPFW